ncbi:MAG: hypothetical protein HQL56_03800 [Magnetococcales bacterium]|nr:hypothetical protein [Magnetococcales bacterium]
MVNGEMTLSAPVLEPIRDQDIAEVCAFIREHHATTMGLLPCQRAFCHDWDPDKPNNGYLLRDGERLVGVLGAIYSRRLIRGREERLLNLTSWVVLEPYRAHSLKLMQALLKQPGFHVTSLSPSAHVVRLYERLKFQFLDNASVGIPHLFLPRLKGGGLCTEEVDLLKEGLPAEVVRILHDHDNMPSMVGTRRLIVGTPQRSALVFFRIAPHFLQPLLAATLLYVSDAEILLANLDLVKRHLLWRYRALHTRVALRHLGGRRPWLAWDFLDVNRQQYLSQTLHAADFDNLYSEWVA